MPEAPMALVDRTPPEGLTGKAPPRSVSPVSTIFQPSPGPAMSWPSSHMGSYQLKGTYSSAMSISERGLVMPAWRYTSWAHSTPAWGLTGLRPGKLLSSLLTDRPWNQAAGWEDRLAPSSLVSITAQAPSEEGQDSWKRMGSHSMGDSFTCSKVMSGIFRWAYGFLAALRRSLTATIQPM